MDKITTERRSANMRAIRSRDTAPEITIRRMLSKMGYRYRLYAKDVPGKPDIVFRGRKKAILVHGCFWHQHAMPECSDSRRPKTNSDYWEAKLTRNVERDAVNAELLKTLGWSALIIWECQLRDPDNVAKTIRSFLGSPKPSKRGGQARKLR